MMTCDQKSTAKSNSVVYHNTGDLSQVPIFITRFQIRVFAVLLLMKTKNEKCYFHSIFAST